jgi:hypothetical protein
MDGHFPQKEKRILVRAQRVYPLFFLREVAVHCAPQIAPIPLTHRKQASIYILKTKKINSRNSAQTKI